MYAAGAYLHFPNPHTCFNRFTLPSPPTFLHHRLFAFCVVLEDALCMCETNVRLCNPRSMLKDY